MLGDKGEIYIIVGISNSLYAKSHSRECALPMKKNGYATELV